MKRWRSVVALAFVCSVALPAAVASAHATLIASSVVDGSIVATAPTTVTLTFDEEVLVTSSSAAIVNFTSGDTTAVKVAGVPGDGASLLLTMPQLPHGPYILRFTIVDPADLHRTAGSISFGVASPPPPSESNHQLSVPWWASAARTLGDLGMIVGIGSAAVLLAAGSLISATDRRRLARVGQWAAIGTVLGWMVVLVGDTTSTGWSNVAWSSVLIRSVPGRRVVIGIQLAIGTWWVHRLARRSGDAAHVFLAKVSAVLWAAIVLLAAIGGHSGIGGNVWVGSFIRFLHLASIGSWLGAVAVAGMLGAGDSRRALWARVSLLAAVGLAITGASGLLLSGRVVETVTALLTTHYGKVIVAKMAGLVALAFLGFSESRRVAAGETPTLRGLAPELMVGAWVIALGSVLAGSAPAKGEQFLPLPVNVPQQISVQADDLTINATLDPAYPGDNFLLMKIGDTVQPSPGAIDRVDIDFTDAAGAVVSSVSGTPTDGEVNLAGVDVPLPGDLSMVIRIDRPTAPVAAVTTPVHIEPAPVPRVPTKVSDQGWQEIAWVLATAWIVLVAIVRRRTRPPVVSPAEPVS